MTGDHGFPLINAPTSDGFPGKFSLICLISLKHGDLTPLPPVLDNKNLKKENAAISRLIIEFRSMGAPKERKIISFHSVPDLCVLER